MATVFPNIDFPELFFGFVAAVGVDLSQTIEAFRTYLESEGYTVVEIKVTNSFKFFSDIVRPNKVLKTSPLKDRYLTYIAYGNQLRSFFRDDSILASVAVGDVMRHRNSLARGVGSKPFSRTAFLVHQFKRKEEIDLLRSVYGRLFFQVSVYSRRGARVDFLARRFAESQNSTEAARFRADAESIVQRDENEIEEEHGQRVAKIFHDADLIINADTNAPTVRDQTTRFCELLFGSNSISPTKIEYGMFLARAAALRTLDLSRQVGAAIFSPAGEIISLGSNEVPKAGGGTYWSDDEFDDREYVRGHDSNDKRKMEILRSIIEAVDPSFDVEAITKRKAMAHSPLMDALEYGRIVHAEMSAISDAARNGRSVRDAVLYSTTFPCHMCAKHIVASGLARVIFLEPYPKSLAYELHSDSIEIESSDRGQYKRFPAVQFEHFYGVTPRRYRDLFDRGRRKSEGGTYQPYSSGTKRPVVDVKTIFYAGLESFVVQSAYEALKRSLSKRKRK